MNRSANYHLYSDVIVTLENFHSAYTTVLDPDNWDQVDHYGIMTLMLRCAGYLIAAGRGHGTIERIELNERFRVLGCCEVTLRIGTIPQDENLQIMQRMRLDALAEINNLLSNLEEQPKRIPSSFLDSLATYFQVLASADKSTSHLLHTGWLDVFDTFSPLIHQLWSYSPAYWDTGDASRWRDATGGLRAKRDAVRQAFNTYVLTVDEACCPMKTLVGQSEPALTSTLADRPDEGSDV
ncbi:hypothetical protein FRC00_001288 [Tulasnella sp. 408]|nr:hypothetical protein FRC00_001288 [Tulasnella sp. 408]